MATVLLNLSDGRHIRLQTDDVEKFLERMKKRIVDFEVMEYTNEKGKLCMLNCRYIVTMEEE